VCMCVAMQLADNFTRTRVFAELGTRPSGRRHPQCPAAVELNSEEYLECFVRQNTMSGYHLAGTCRMGAAGDNTAVVDPQLRSVRFRKSFLPYSLSLSLSLHSTLTAIFPGEPGLAGVY